jgi:hypothetical protein
MSQSYPMTDDSFGAKLASFKARVDGAVESALEFEPVGAALAAINYRKFGGLHFATIGGANVSWSFKKKRATKPIKAKEAPVHVEPVASLNSPSGFVDLNSPHMAQRYATFVKMAR